MREVGFHQPSNSYMVKSWYQSLLEEELDALDALHSRISVPRLGGDIPSEEVLSNIFRAALRAADHGVLRPWRFLVIKGGAREKLGDLFVQAACHDDPDMNETQREKVRQKPLRAPLIVIALASIQAHEKIPEIEQIISAGAAVQNMMVAAHAQGVGAMWRTGSMAYHPEVAKGLDLSEREKIVGFLYLGHKQGRDKIIPDDKINTYFKEWKG